jgi:hypothetical protein
VEATVSNYTKRLERKRRERRRKNIILAGTAAAILLLLAIPMLRTLFTKDFEFSDFFMVVDDKEIVTTRSGLEYQDIEIGTGPEAAEGDQVAVHYIGWLTDGTSFDSSIQRNLPFEFELGTRSVIRGWNEGVEGMRVGGVRILMIPPELGYGSQVNAGIPPNSILIFQIELLNITPSE